MWVLEARANAEKVWYPIVWEEVKDASNVIDYNINEEITIDNSSVFNANNDTTTGMANVIPWVNAPKLLQSTSIIGDAQPLSWWVTITGTVDLDYPDDNTDTIRTDWTLSNQYWNIPYKIKTDWSSSLWNWFMFPVQWWYQLYLTYPTGSSSFAIDIEIWLAKWWYGNDVLIHQFTWHKNNTQYYETVRYEFNAWDAIFAYATLRYSWWAVFSVSSNLTIDVSKV